MSVLKPCCDDQWLGPPASQYQATNRIKISGRMVSNSRYQTCFNCGKENRLTALQYRKKRDEYDANLIRGFEPEHPKEEDDETIKKLGRRKRSRSKTSGQRASALARHLFKNDKREGVRPIHCYGDENHDPYWSILCGTVQ